MEISFLGVGCIKLGGRGVTLLSDPFDDSFGLPAVKLAADAILLTGAEGTQTSPDALLIDGPGEYEVKGAVVTGVSARRHSDAEGELATVYAVQIEGWRVLICGNITPGLSSQQLEALGEADVLIVPVGGHGLTLDARAAADLVSKLEPKFVIPTHYADEPTKYPVPQDDVTTFCKEMGSNPEPISKLRLTTKDLPQETTLVILKRPE